MKFETILPHLRAGKRARRAGTWGTDAWIKLSGDRLVCEEGPDESWDSIGPQFFDGVDDWELVAEEPKSLGQIAYEAYYRCPNPNYEWPPTTAYLWDECAQAVRAEVLREAHRELTTDECLRVSDHCDGTPGQITAAVRKADELRAKR